MEEDFNLFSEQPSIGPSGLSAYIATPITNASEAALERINDAVIAIDRFLREQLRFERVHVPKDYTSPTKRPDMLGKDVARVDKDLLLGSDLMIFLAEEPSTGSGMEVAWSVDAGLHLFIGVSADTTFRPSRIAVGSSERAAEERYETIPQLLALIEQYVHSNAASLERHRRWRQNAPVALAPLMAALLPLANSARFGFAALESGTPPERNPDAGLLEVCAESAAHCAGLTIGELLRIELDSGRRAFQTVNDAYPSDLMAQLLDGIRNWPGLASTSGADVVAMLVGAQRELANVSARANFNDPQFWQSRKRSRE